jgi:hypothetical protein
MCHVTTELPGQARAFAELLLPGNIPVNRVRFNAKQEYEYLENFKILQKCFNQNKIDKASVVLHFVFLVAVRGERGRGRQSVGRGRQSVGRRREAPMLSKCGNSGAIEERCVGRCARFDCLDWVYAVTSKMDNLARRSCWNPVLTSSQPIPVDKLIKWVSSLVHPSTGSSIPCPATGPSIPCPTGVRAHPQPSPVLNPLLGARCRTTSSSSSG